MARKTLYNKSTTNPSDMTGWTASSGDIADWDIAVGHICAASDYSLSPVYADQNGYFSSAAGYSTVDSEVYQDFDVSGDATEIDAGSVDYDFDGYHTAYGDQGGFALEFYDVGMSIIGSRVATTEDNPGCSWAAHALSGTVPTNTRTVRLIMVANDTGGSYNRNMFDDMVLAVTGVASGDQDTEVSAVGVSVVGEIGVVDTEVSSVAVAVVALRSTAPTPISHNELSSFFFFG